LLGVQWINSWWWTEELSETYRVSCQNKFAKLVHLDGFIIKKFVTMHGHVNVKYVDCICQWLRTELITGRGKKDFFFTCLFSFGNYTFALDIITFTWCFCLSVLLEFFVCCLYQKWTCSILGGGVCWATWINKIYRILLHVLRCTSHDQKCRRRALRFRRRVAEDFVLNTLSKCWYMYRHFVEFYYICPTNAQYIFLTALLHVSTFIHHPQGVSNYVRWIFKNLLPVQFPSHINPGCSTNRVIH
jgi:hypothetical protein